MKILHISDIHFSHFVKNPWQFFSKTWIGNANLLLKRGRRLQPAPFEKLIEIFLKLDCQIIVISGDFTTTSQPQEFQKAKDFLECLKKHHFQVYIIPGNHDHYSRKAFQKQLFYHYLGKYIPSSDKYQLKQDKIAFHNLPDCQLVLLDLTIATPWFTAYGAFSQKMAESLNEIMNLVSHKKPLVVCGHFPILKQDFSFHHALKHGHRLLELINTHPLCYYIHGHNHKQTVICYENICLIDSGSLSDIQKGSFCVLDTDNRTITHFHRQAEGFKKGISYER